MPCPSVRLVVLNYNGGEHVLRCVEHLEALDWPRDRLDLVVVDNDSSDGSDDAIEARFPKVRLLRTGRNTGFPANNLGLRDLEGIDFVGLVNNDAFVEPGWLRALVDEIEPDPGVGAVCPKILLAARFVDVEVRTPGWRAPGDGRDLGVQLTGLRVDGADRLAAVGGGAAVHEVEQGPHGPFRWLGPDAVLRVPVGEASPPRVEVRLAAPSPVEATVAAGAGAVSVAVGPEPAWSEVPVGGEPYDVINNAGSELVAGGWGRDRGFLERDEGQFDEAQDVFAWCGAGVLFRPSHLEDVGLFDERFFMYYEDTDLAWRGRARGWRYRYTPRAVMRHVHAATSVEGSPMFQHYVERNRLVMLAKNAPAWLLRDAVVGFCTATASYALRDVVRPLLRLRRPRVGLVRARTRSFLAFLAMAPELRADRRRLRARQLVPDQALVGWAVPQ